MRSKRRFRLRPDQHFGGHHLRVRFARAGLVLLAGVTSGPASAQSAGLPCGDCPSKLTLKLCTIEQTVHEGTGCSWYGKILNNCQPPQLTEAGVEVIPEATLGSFTARLLLEAKVPWNSDASSDPSTRLQLHWSIGDVAELPGFTGCNMSAVDHAYNALQKEGLSCAGAPYDFGSYSVAGLVCEGRTGCAMVSRVEGMKFVVTKAKLGCPIIPTQSCNGDDGTSCRDCLAGGVGIGGGLGIGGSGGTGDPATGDGAYLFYTAGGPGHVGLPGSAAWRVTLGRHWSHSYAQRIVPDPDESHVWLITEHGTFREWSDLDTMTGIYQTVAPSNEYRTLTWTGSGWTLEELDGTVHAFDGGGLWTSTTDRNANGGLNAKVATYVGNVLDHVTFPDDTREDFAYYPAGDPSEGKLKSITVVGVDLSTTRTWTYHWTGDDLTRIDRPDDTKIHYLYGDIAHPGYLTRITLEGTDGTSTRVERAYEYDARGNVVATWRGDADKTGPDAVDLWQLSFDDPTNPTVTTVTDPLDQEITYHLEHETDSASIKVTSIDGDCPVCSLGPNAELRYEDPDSPGHPLLPKFITDGRGVVTHFVYTDHGQVAERTEADSTLEMRKTSWTYDQNYPGLVTKMEVQSTVGDPAIRTTEWLRDSSGNPTTRRITGVEAASAFSYDTVTSFNGAGQPLTVDPPGHGADDLTTWIYTPPNVGDPDRGELFPFTRTDPIIGDTVFGYDPFNRRASVTDPNGVKTQTSYDDLDRVTEVRQLLGSTPQTGDLVTQYKYNPFRDLSQTILPRGNVIQYGYDPAGRLISVERKPDALPETHGERTFYSLNEAGNRTLEEQQVWDADTAQWVTLSATEYHYTNRCQVDQVIQAPGEPEQAVTDYSYDCNGNLEKVWDPNHPRFDPVTSDELLETALYQYDAFNRLTSVTQPWGGAGGGFTVTSYDYDVQDHLTQVTDAEGNVTSYTYSDRDLLTEQISPVGDQSAKIKFVQAKSSSPTPRDQPVATAAATLAATTAYEYDPHGELIKTTDPRGVVVTRIVDALDRVTRVEYPGTALDVDYDYDTQPAACGGTSFPVGRLGSITRDGQAVESCYDRFGRTTRDGDLTYDHDANGNRTTIGYPGSVQASIMYDLVADRPESLTVTSPGGPGAPGHTENVVTAASYLPAGPLTGLALGSGTTEIRAFDSRYAPAAIGISGDPAGVGDHTWSYTTDPVGNVLEIVERAVCPDAPKVLTPQTVTTTETFTSCSDLQAGGGFIVDSPGNVTFEAQGTIALGNGFSVLSGATFTAGSVGAPELSRRSFAYQDVQYFLAGATGPWPEDLAWTYDQIGNRLTETRTPPNGVPVTDTYQYLVNDATGNSPVLDQVTLGIGGTRGYTWDAAGNLDRVGANANVIDFAFDDESRLASAGRAVADVSSNFLYDGRSFLRSAVELQGDPPAEAASVRPLYSSDGLLQALRRKASPTDPEELVIFLYFAGRPVAQLAIDGTGAETWTYLTTDHLGTPLLATDEAGAVVWEGGFEPFGTDWQAGTPAGALDSGTFLRLPGQWEDATWGEAAAGAGFFYNVNRFYSPSDARFLRVDPERLTNPVVQQAYSYGRMNPLSFADPLGLRVTHVDEGIESLLHCAVKGSQRFRNPIYRWFLRDGDDWEVRVHPKPSGDPSPLPGYCTGSSCWERPTLFHPGRIWIISTGGCLSEMTSLMHEFAEIYASEALGLSTDSLSPVTPVDPNDPFQSPAHHYAKTHDRELAREACCKCQP